MDEICTWWENKNNWKCMLQIKVTNQTTKEAI